MKRMLFFQQGLFSHTNNAVFNGLCEQFPEAEIRRVDINDYLKSHKSILLANAFHACRLFGWDLIRQKRDLDDSFFSTPYIFNTVRRFALEVHKQWPADCSFQTQSIFDCSGPHTPHFVYTDHTYRSCREYPVYGKSIVAPIRREWLIEMEQLVYEHAACTFTMSQNVTRALLDKYGLSGDRVLCARTGCHAHQDRLAEIPTSIERYKNKHILFLGRLWGLKGGEELVQAFRLVRKVHSDAILTIVGCKPKLAEPNTRVMGYANLDEVVDYYTNASVFCMPSKIEAFGIVFLEAMSAGLPVIALRLGATPDFVLKNETGTLVEYGDIHGLAGALRELLDDPEKCKRFGENGRALCMQQYTWRSTCKAMHDRILEVVENYPAPTGTSSEH
ncbi:MAG: glycosyltransferase family 4 protein [Planctomycetes bacterium]|nr:glycosyltransferase family 4 protein [Planctomycetota bacterium]